MSTAVHRSTPGAASASTTIPAPPPVTRADRWGVACLLAAGLALALTALVVAVPRPSLDVEMRAVLMASRTEHVVAVADWLGQAGTWRGLGPLGAVLLLSPRIRRRWWLFGLALIGAPVLGDAWQALVARPRPTGHALGFPSGHATAAGAFAAIAVYAASDLRWPPTVRSVVRGAAVALTVGVAASRVVLGAHWPSDVLVGLALGSGTGATAVWWDRRHTSPGAGRRPVAALPLLVVPLLLAGAGQAGCDRATTAPPGQRPIVTASIYPLYEFTRHVAGDRMEVMAVVPPGIEPHDWEPSPRELVDLRRARLLV